MWRRALAFGIGRGRLAPPAPRALGGVRVFRSKPPAAGGRDVQASRDATPVPRADRPAAPPALRSSPPDPLSLQERGNGVRASSPLSRRERGTGGEDRQGEGVSRGGRTAQ